MELICFAILTFVIFFMVVWAMSPSKKTNWSPHPNIPPDAMVTCENCGKHHSIYTPCTDDSAQGINH